MAVLLLAADLTLATGRTAAAEPRPAAVVGSHPQAEQPSAAEVREADLAWAQKHSRGGIAWALAEAKKTGKKTLAPDETTPTNLTYANPDGTLTSEVTTGPERMERDGKWVDVDATLTTTADGGVQAKAHPEGLTLAPGGGTPSRSLRAAQGDAGRDLVSLGRGDERVTLQWKGGLPKPVLDGTTATYKDAVPGADVIVKATRTGFEQFVKLDAQPTAGDYTYTLPLKAKGLKATAQKDGSVLFTDADTGVRRATMPAPVMWDASVDKVSGRHENRARVGMKVTDNGGGNIDLQVTPDAAFLADPDTTYPVTVDPSTSALGNTFDTYVQQGETTDLGGETELDFGNPGTINADGTPRTARTLMTWNTAGFADALVSSASVQLYNFHSGATDCKAQGWTVWNTGAGSGASRWTKQPAWLQQYGSSTQTAGYPAGCTGTAGGWIKADVTDLAKVWASQKATSGYMGVRAASDDATGWKRVNSRNATVNQPKLTVNYNYRPGDGTDQQAGAPFKSYAGVWAVNSTTPTLRDKFPDADGDKVNGTFQVYDAATNKPITTPAGDGAIVSADVAPGSWASVKVPAGQLVNGKTYKFRTNSYDGTHYNLNWSPWREFVVDTTAPGAPTSIASATYPENWGGGGKGITGTFDVNTGVSDARDVQYRSDPYEDDAADANWSTVATSLPKAAIAAEATASYSVTPAEDGNHTVQTRSVDRADNVGPIRDYGFTAGNRDYNRKQKIDIKLPDNDFSSPQPDPTDPPQPALGQWKQGSQARVFKTGDGIRVTVTPKGHASKEFTKKAAKERNIRAGSRPDPVVTDAWCQPTLSGEAQKSLMTRTEACVFFDLQLTMEAKLQDGFPPTKYRANWEVAFQVKTDVHGGAIKTWVEINPVYNDFPGDERAVVMGDGNPNASFDSKCVGAGCDSQRKSFDFFGDLSWKGGGGASPVDTHMATGTSDYKWNGQVDNASGTTDADQSTGMLISFTGKVLTETEPPTGVNGEKGEWLDPGDFQSPFLLVKCDKVASYGVPGCVLSEYMPTYKFNTAAYPEAAAHAWLIQNKSKVKGLGQSWEGQGPLSYLPPPSRNKEGYDSDKSRDRMCTRYRGPKSGSTGWVPGRTFLPHPKTALHHDPPHLDEVNCDEFPFASTYQSAGMKKTDGGRNEAPGGGADCMQTVSAVADDGTTHFLDDTRYDAPTFTENCGRSSMSGDVNQGSMRPFGDFASKMRILDQEGYFLDPGNAWFKECDTSKAELVCTMKKP
ncbi:DNRLRE domain-containing protein [Streptomyces sp. NBC_01306]|uniref:DNRLRE domain-containing protein n=1 Tax=Streptomyces sp. NBC_01306 TaxID=2903819 RepID=UPI00225000C4|nr:DNRLRE domain-containing protein [Streptomyces sp. NBC_01306]MCX4722439.1 DNRLRE domain-containing protein [Streptomyces sp. NBC_01306]